MILVDQAVWPWRGRLWAHLVSDTDYDELHRFAAGVGLRRVAFQGDHYDVDAHTRAAALGAGAVAVDARELVRRLRQAGLRRRADRADLAWRQTAAWPAAVLEPDPAEPLLDALAAQVGRGPGTAMAVELRTALGRLPVAAPLIDLNEPLVVRLLIRPGEVALVLDRADREGLPLADVVVASS